MPTVALRPVSIHERDYQPGDLVDTRDLPGRRVAQLLRYGTIKSYDDGELLADLIERVERLEAALGARPSVVTNLRVETAEGAEVWPTVPPTTTGTASTTPTKIKRGGAKPGKED